MKDQDVAICLNGPSNVSAKATALAFSIPKHTSLFAYRHNNRFATGTIATLPF